MTYRLKSTDVFWNFPGVVACYMPVGAPDPLSARINVRSNQATPTQYAAKPGVAPTWAADRGWGFIASWSQWLDTGVVPASGYSLLVRFSGLASLGWVIGAYNSSGNNRLSIGNPNGSNWIEFGSGKTSGVIYGAAVTAGVFGVANQQGYRDGLAIGSAIADWNGPVVASIGIAKLNGLTNYCTVVVQAAAVYRRTLTPSEVWQASQQMKYCDVNPDWSAWGARRRYYYAPSGALGLAFSPIGSGVVGSSVIRSKTV